LATLGVEKQRQYVKAVTTLIEGQMAPPAHRGVVSDVPAVDPTLVVHQSVRVTVVVGPIDRWPIAAPAPISAGRTVNGADRVVG
jgi:hypothetical protein